jgi:hypothetical protein
VIAFGGTFVGSEGTASIDIAAAVPNATSLDLDLTNHVGASGGGASASKTSADITVFIPEPAASLSLPPGCLLVALLAWRRERPSATTSSKGPVDSRCGRQVEGLGAATALGP